MKSATDEWLNLSETAEALGAHPSTVRQWADRGELPSQRTPGGHRRFRRADVQARAATIGRNRQAGAQLVIQTMIGRARLELTEGSLHEQEWYRRLDAPAKEALRGLGYRLLHQVQRALTLETSPAADPAETQAIGEDYARLGRENGLSLTETTAAYLFFREFLEETLLDIALTAGAQSPTDWGELHRRAMRLTDHVLLALIDSAHKEIRVEGL